MMLPEINMWHWIVHEVDCVCMCIVGQNLMFLVILWLIFLSSCHFFTVELASTLNDPEGFLIQARNGTNISSEIIGTFLDPTVVRARNPAEVNYKILSCNQSIFDMESSDPLPVSVTVCVRHKIKSSLYRSILLNKTGLCTAKHAFVISISITLSNWWL